MAIQELSKNKYKIVIALGYNGNKRTRHIETFHGGKKDAQLRESELKIQLNNDTYIKKNKMTFEELINEWLKVKENKIGIKTFKTYKLYSKNIIRCLGHIHLKNINVKVLEDFYNELRTNTTFADKTIKHHYTIVSSVLNDAINWGYISNNPNKKVDKIKVKKKDVKYYTPEQVGELIKSISSECLKYQSLILLAIDSGCRRGEITGLLWSDIDFDKSTIDINKTTQYVAGVGSFEKSTKTETSNRIVYIAPTTLRVLKQYQAEQYSDRLRIGSKWLGSKRVFTTDFGADMHPNTPSAILSKIVKRHNLEYINFHGLRHTSISLQIASGIQAQIISKRAGHSNLATTHDIYSHFFESGFQDVADKMDKFLDINKGNIC
jgi:integrase